MSQTSVSLYQDGAKVGQLADLAIKEVISGLNKASGEVALFGHFMSLGADAEAVKRPAAATDITDLKLGRGVVLATHELESSETGDPQYPVDSAVPLLRKGRIWVKAEDQITVGTSTVNVRYAGSGNKGAFLGAAVSMETGALPDDNAKWLSSTSGAGQLALLEINL